MREPLIPQLEAEEYLLWENRQRERFELHHGFVVAFAGGTVDHDTIAFNVRSALSRAFAAPCRTLGSDVKLKVTEDVVFYPDAMVVCEPVRGDATVVSGPAVVCEILSESTRTFDLVDKRAAYRQISSLTAYVVVETRTRRVEVDTRADSGTWQTSTFEDGILPLGSQPITVADVYERTSIGS